MTVQEAKMLYDSAVRAFETTERKINSKLTAKQYLKTLQKLWNVETFSKITKSKRIMQHVRDLELYRLELNRTSRIYETLKELEHEQSRRT